MDKGSHQQAEDGAIQIGQARDVYIGPRRLPSGAPFQAPPLPVHFVPRPEVSEDVKARMLADAAAAPGALVVSAVYGLGGIGKTTLVAALTHTPDVQARFPDGVLWVTLGQQPDVLSLLAGWIQALGDYDFRPTVVESASAHLRTLLHDKACLLVVDDAWQADHVRAFLLGGPRCRLVVTTRNAALARKVGARLYDLDVMTEAQALALFHARLGPLNGNCTQAAALARELGYLPLALELAAAQVEAGLSWTELLDAFRQALADLSVLDLDKPTYRNESLSLSFSLSLDGLPPDGRGGLSPEDRQAFAWLGVLPEDARLNPAMAATLWDQPEAETRRRLRRLRDKALLKTVGDDRYTLHDLLCDEAKLRLAERMSLPEAHTTLLNRYLQKAPGEQWHHLLDDGYIHAHLTWHMEHAGQPEAIHALLRLETPEGRNAWYEAREALGQTAGYLEDVRRAWLLSEEEFAIRCSPFSIGLQCRYALITASLNSLVKNIHPVLLAALVKQGVWTPAQGLAYARQVTNSAQRAKVLGRLVPHLPKPLLREALAVLRTTEDNRVLAEVLMHLAPKLADLGYPYEALKTVQMIDEWELGRVWVLVELASHLQEPLRGKALREALAVAQEIESGWEYERVQAMATLAPRLAEFGYYQESLAAALEIQDKDDPTQGQAGLASHLQESDREQTLRAALAAVWVIEDDWAQEKAKALMGLAPHLPEPLLREALAATWAIEDHWARAKMLSRLAPHLADLGYLQEALAAAREIGSGDYRAEALAGLAPFLLDPLKGEVLQEALAAAQAIQDEHDRARALVGLAPFLSDPLKSDVLWEALAAAQEIEWERGRAVALANLAPHLPELLLREALAVAQAIQDEHDQARALAELAPYLPEPKRRQTLRKVLVAVWKIRDEDDRARALAGLAPHLSGPLLEEVLATAWEIRDKLKLAEALAELAPRLAELGYSQKALITAREIESVYYRADALAGLARHLPKPTQEKVLREALAALRETMIEEELLPVQVLARLAPHLSKGLAGEALALVQESLHEDDWAHGLAVLAPHLPAPEREQVMKEAWAASREIEVEQFKAEALARLAPHLPEPEREQAIEEALAAAAARSWSIDRAEALAGLVPYLPELEWEELIRKVLSVAREIEELDEDEIDTVEQWGVVKALRALAPRISETVVEEVLVETLAIRDEHNREQALAGLAPHLAKLTAIALIPLWQRTLRISATRTRQDVLTDIRALGPVVVALGGTKAVEEIARAIQDVGRWWP